MYNYSLVVLNPADGNSCLGPKQELVVLMPVLQLVKTAHKQNI